MRNVSVLASLSIALVCGAVGRADAGGGPPALDSKSLPPLTKKMLRTTGPTLSAKRFDEKWRSSLSDMVMFTRSYPGAHWARMKQVDPEEVPGKIGTAFGDLHFGQ